MSSSGLRIRLSLWDTTTPSNAARAEPTHLPPSMVANERPLSKSRPMRFGVKTSTSPMSVTAQDVNPARTVPSASGSYQIWFSISYSRWSGNSLSCTLTTAYSLEREQPALAVHDVLDHGGGAHQPVAFRDQVALGLVEQFEVRRAGPEPRALVVRLLDPVVHGLRVARLDAKLLRHALEHQLAGGGRAQHVDLVIHGRGHGRIIERRAQLLDVARVGVDQNDEQAAAHCSS